jgi:hypothetical protein
MSVGLGIYYNYGILGISPGSILYLSFSLGVGNGLRPSVTNNFYLFYLLKIRAKIIFLKKFDSSILSTVLHRG